MRKEYSVMKYLGPWLFIGLGWTYEMVTKLTGRADSAGQAPLGLN